MTKKLSSRVSYLKQRSVNLSHYRSSPLMAWSRNPSLEVSLAVEVTEYLTRFLKISSLRLTTWSPVLVW